MGLSQTLHPTQIDAFETAPIDEGTCQRCSSEFGALNVKYRDIRLVLPFLIQLWLFVSAVIVPLSVLPQKWRWAVALNPMSGIIEGYRAALFGQPFNWKALGVAAVITCAVLVNSAYAYRLMEKSFADII